MSCDELDLTLMVSRCVLLKGTKGWKRTASKAHVAMVKDAIGEIMAT